MLMAVDMQGAALWIPGLRTAVGGQKSELRTCEGASIGRSNFTIFIPGRLPRIDVLVNNAGAVFPGLQVTNDGVEMGAAEAAASGDAR